MSSKLPVIVGFGGFNSAGRSSGHLAYQRMIFDSLDVSQQENTINALSNMMDIDKELSEEERRTAVLDGTLVRKIEASLFDVENAPVNKKIELQHNTIAPVTFTVSSKQLPKPLPENWQVDPLDDLGRQYRVTLSSSQMVKVDATEEMAVKAAGQLPSGFDPSTFYRSQHHPRGLQMAIMGASDAVKSMGIPWSDVASSVSPDEVAVYSSSVMSQLDSTGFGGLLNARNDALRVTSKQLALGLNTMPADFINAYVLGSVGATGGVTGACATFLYNLRQGVEDIREGRRRVVVVGASEAPILPSVIDGYAAMSALATDADLRKLDGVESPDYRRASRPFGANCGFTLSESSQYTILMDDELALELGAQIFGAVPAVYINADGFKKSISAPGAGNYVTMSKAVGLAVSLLGEDAVKKRSFIQAHGSSTPQNRTTESKIFDEVAKAFGIESWPVSAVKSYVGHSLGPASGDQMASTLGVFKYGVIPGIKTLDGVAPDVYGERLSISVEDQAVGAENCDVSFLNSKGFGGNNATAPVFSPTVTKNYLRKHYSAELISAYEEKLKVTELAAESYISSADSGDFNPIYEFGKNLIDEDKIELTKDSLKIPGYSRAIDLNIKEGFDGF